MILKRGSGWFVRGVYRCPSLKAAREFIDRNLDEHDRARAAAALRVLRNEAAQKKAG